MARQISFNFGLPPGIDCNFHQSLPPATQLGQGYVFTRVCHSVHRVGSAPLHAGIHTPPGQEAGTPSPGTRGRHPQHWDQSQAPPRTRGRHPPPSEVHAGRWEIRATSGRYASYWNAILFHFVIAASPIAEHKRLTHQQFFVTKFKKCFAIMFYI